MGYSGKVDGTPPSWMFEYKTDLPLEDREALACEAIDLWPNIVPEVRAAGVTRATFWPTSKQRKLVWAGWRPVVISNKQTALVLVQASDGTWQPDGGWPHDGCRP